MCEVPRAAEKEFKIEQAFVWTCSKHISRDRAATVGTRGTITDLEFPILGDENTHTFHVREVEYIEESAGPRGE